MSFYPVDGSDQVHPLSEVPQSSIGAPLPTVVSDELTVVVGFLLQDTPEGWDGTTCRIIEPDTGGRPIALVTFRRYQAYLFGPPNDEAFAGHPLAARGLEPYGAYEVQPSSWIARLERMNVVHPHHRPESFSQLRHFALTFHDSTFECAARSMDLELHQGSIRSLAPRMHALLDADGTG